MKILLEIVYNLGMLVSISILSGFIGDPRQKSVKTDVTQGTLFGFAAVLGMLHPLVLAPGLIFDGRSVMIAIVSLFFGPLAGGVSVVMPLLLRMYQGGPGETMGVLVILSSAVIGSAVHLMRRNESGPISMNEILGVGISVHVVMVLLMLTLPPDKALPTIRQMGLPVIITYPFATALIGKILMEAAERRRVSETLREQYKRLEESEYNFRNLFEGSADAILIFKDTIIVDCNAAAAQLLGTGEKDSVMGRTPWDLSPEYQGDGVLSSEKGQALILACIREKMVRFEWTHLRPDGVPFPVEVVLTSIILRGEKVFHALVRDMSVRKSMEEQLAHMSYHDQLTGVFNRRYFEEEMSRLDTDSNLPMTLMMADVNGLKLVNDSFGHHAGDRLLTKVTELIQACCRDGDIISRIGGDEFVILFPRTEEQEAEIIAERIQALASRETIESVEISISFGWAAKRLDAVSVSEVLKQAEDHLYKKKLFESPSMRGKTIRTIIHTLHEKNKREEQHSHRVSEICERMGQAMGLSEADVKELRSVGLLHDIGKIAIDEHMLNKAGKLTDDEWKDMMRHPEIGYRILSTVNEMSEMAEYVLAHHERWDGNGYPRGLKGEEIPLQARIIALADAYDAMTSDRSYRSAMSPEAAMEELLRNAGSQFDPQLVDLFAQRVFMEEAALA